MLALVVAAAGLVGPPEAPPGLALRWEAPPGCPGEAEVRARVVRMTGEEAVRTARLSARGTVREEAPGRWALELELSGETGGGRRSLQAGRCDELAEAGALVVAIAVDPDAALGGGVVPPPPEEVGGATGPEGQEPAGDGVANETGPKGQAIAAPVDAADPVQEEAEVEDVEGTGLKGPVRTDSTWPRVSLRAAGGVSFARLLPGPSGAVSLVVSVSGRRWRAEIGGLYAPPVPGGTAAIGGLFQVGAVELRGCPVLRRGKVEVPLCAGLQIGAMQGRGRGTMLVETSTERSPWLALTLGAALGWRPHPRVGPWLQADAIVALLRPGFVTAGGVRVHEAARFGGQVLAGIEVGLR